MESGNGAFGYEGRLVEVLHLGADEDLVFPVGQIVDGIQHEVFVGECTDEAVRGKVNVAENDDPRLLAAVRGPLDSGPERKGPLVPSHPRRQGL